MLSPIRLGALLAFLRSQAAGGLALIAAAALALVWSNDSGADLYFRLMATRIWILPIDGWVNDGLMTLFFLTVGLEIRCEMTEGALSSRRQIVVPAVAAIGGMAVPALIFAGFNHADAARLHGWAVPTATDIAFALAALSALGRRVPVGLKVFLTALAIIDDLGAIIVIALFYTAAVDLPSLAVAAAVCTTLYGLNRAGVRAVWAYAAGGLMLWTCVLRSGVHPTVAGVALAFVVPLDDTGHRLEVMLGRWVTWLVLPLFGLANAGLRLRGVSFADFGTPVMLGVAVGLVVGKPLGVFGTLWVAERLGWVRRPAALTWKRLFGAALLCGIGFTMSLFIGDLAFRASQIHAEVKLAVLTGSLISAGLGLLWLRFTDRRPSRPGHAERHRRAATGR